MSNPTTAAGDDAPATTAKSRPAGADANGLVEAGGVELVGRSVTINRPRAELYAVWADLTRLPTFMENVVSIEPIGEARTHWTVKAPGGGTVEWDARITEQRDGEVIAWAAEPGADVPNAGRVEFKDAGVRGTVVTATIAYDPPAGVVGKLVAKLFQREPAIQARRDLRRFKQLMETGEIATSRMNAAQIEEYGR